MILCFTVICLHNRVFQSFIVEMRLDNVMITVIKPYPHKAADSRYVHRGAFRWDLAEKRFEEETPQYKIFRSILKMEGNPCKRKSIFDRRSSMDD